MINMKPLVYEKLTSITENVSGSYPSDWATFPVIQYTEEQNEPDIWTSEGEAHTLVAFKIDIWVKEGSTSQLAQQVNDAMYDIGLYRKGCSDIDEPSGLKHKVMRFKASINIRTNISYLA